MESAATSLIIIATAAFVLPLAAARLGVPAVVLEILFGMLIGPVATIVVESELINQLGELGFFLLMFLSGFELDLPLLQRQGSRQIIVALTVFGLTGAGSLLVANSLGYPTFFAFVLATTSVGLVVPTLRGVKQIATTLGQAILISALLADFLTLLGVTVYALIQEGGDALNILLIPAFFVLVVAVLLTLRRAAWWYPARFERLFDADDPQELGIRASLALMLVFVGLSIVFGIEPILGAFLAGSVFSLVFRNRAALDQKLAGFSYGFLIPVFFINVGIRFDLAAMRQPGAIATTVVLIGFAILVKLLPSLAFLVHRLRLREVLAGGVLLSARLSLIIAVAELGVRLGVLDRSLEASIILLAITTTVAAPAGFRLILASSGARARAPESDVT